MLKQKRKTQHTHSLGTFLYVKVSLHAANQALWRAVA